MQRSSLFQYVRETLNQCNEQAPLNMSERHWTNAVNRQHSICQRDTEPMQWTGTTKYVRDTEPMQWTGTTQYVRETLNQCIEQAPLNMSERHWTNAVNRYLSICQRDTEPMQWTGTTQYVRETLNQCSEQAPLNMSERHWTNAVNRHHSICQRHWTNAVNRPHSICQRDTEPMQWTGTTQYVRETLNQCSEQAPLNMSETLNQCSEQAPLNMSERHWTNAVNRHLSICQRDTPYRQCSLILYWLVWFKLCYFSKILLIYSHMNTLLGSCSV